MMRHVVVGGHGFLGRRLTATLRDAGTEVLVADLPGVRPAGADAACDPFTPVDITHPESVAGLPLERDDVVVHLAARQYHDKVPTRGTQQWFNDVNVDGLRNVLHRMETAGCTRMVFFSTDMVYGVPQQKPVPVSHSRNPVGEYGRSKRDAEDLCARYRERGMQISIMRPRLISGAGRLGVFRTLFKLIERNMPVPLIGDGSNCYQMISVDDCVSATRAAVAKGCPNREFNLGSDDPPTCYDLLAGLIRSVGSRSRLLRTPAGLVKSPLRSLEVLGLPVLHREQYMIADQDYIVDTSTTRSELDWQPRFNDSDMIADAFRYYQTSRLADSARDEA